MDGCLWQRNTGTVSSPSITRGTDGNEISYSDLCDTTFTEQKNLLPHYVTLYSTDAICNGTTSYIYQHPETVLYYWVDGPEAGQEIANNVTDGSHRGIPVSRIPEILFISGCWVPIGTISVHMTEAALPS
jgi:hypothetical protein